MVTEGGPSTVTLTPSCRTDKSQSAEDKVKRVQDLLKSDTQ
jgi:hypothetical protein